MKRRLAARIGHRRNQQVRTLTGGPGPVGHLEASVQNGLSSSWNDPAQGGLFMGIGSSQLCISARRLVRRVF
jgi:hypothetical protein